MSTAYDTTPRLALISALISASDRRMPSGDAVSISTRHHEGMLITPAVHPDNGMTADDIAYVHDNGEADGKLLPASDWRIHLALLVDRPDLHTIIRLNSPAATALAMLRRSLPVVHQSVKSLAGGQITCARFAPSGTLALGQNAVTAMRDRRACLLANNGLVVGADSPADAVRVAQQIELLCDQYLRACAVGDPVVLAPNELN
jgi:L-fuculose-phosphate aldolase